MKNESEWVLAESWKRAKINFQLTESWTMNYQLRSGNFGAWSWKTWQKKILPIFSSCSCHRHPLITMWRKNRQYDHWSLLSSFISVSDYTFPHISRVSKTLSMHASLSGFFVIVRLDPEWNSDSLVRETDFFSSVDFKSNQKFYLKKKISWAITFSKRPPPLYSVVLFWEVATGGSTIIFSVRILSWEFLSN